ncbi:hypothetical protein H5410_026886 [Solanum commersonii]|uniref:Uncharacterized protein n=1 Tax=Solanum commersonii TaxID=4109 RepID=A0A9J5YYB4_SOLCO|nr:hypothetical protein H5410_026886 [Solanum commersonii]
MDNESYQHLFVVCPAAKKLWGIFASVVGVEGPFIQLQDIIYRPLMHDSTSVTQIELLKETQVVVLMVFVLGIGKMVSYLLHLIFWEFKIA